MLTLIAVRRHIQNVSGRKRDGAIVNFELDKITDAIGKAFEATDKQYSEDMLQMLGLRVTADFQKKSQRAESLWKIFRIP